MKPHAITLFALLSTQTSFAQVLPQASTEIKITLAKASVSKPMSITYVPYLSRYYVADGGSGAINTENGLVLSKSQIHSYSDKGEYIQSASPGLDNRSIYYNDSSKKLESITYNISTEAGFGPNTGIFGLDMSENGDLKDTTQDILGTNPAFGTASSIPSLDADNQRYFAKQPRSNLVRIVKTDQREPVGEIKLEIEKAGAKFDDITDYHIAFTGVKGEELALLDVEHKAILVFDLQGKFVAKSQLPTELKLRSQNYISGLGYANGLFFVLHEKEGAFGTFYGFKISDQAK